MIPNDKAHDDLFQDLLDAQSEIWPDAPFPAEQPQEDDFLDFRVQIVSGVAYLHTGDASYDTDHDGSWGAGAVGPKDEASS